MKTTHNIFLLLLSPMCMAQTAKATNPVCESESRTVAARTQGFRNPVLPDMLADNPSGYVDVDWFGYETE